MKILAATLGLAVLCGALVQSGPVRAETVILQDQHRDVIREWIYVNNKGCPPGTRLKKTQRYFGLVKPYRNCVPDPAAKVTWYRPGTVLPTTVTYTELPGTVVSRLPPPPPGRTYVTTENSVYLINPETRTVVDTVTLYETVE